MKFFTFLFIALFTAVFSFSSFAQTIPQHDHVVICVMENHSYSSISGSAFAPYINSLISGTKAARFTQSYGLTHPSQPNYIMLFSGGNQGVTNDNVPGTLPFTVPNLGASLLDSGYTFIGYSEDLPSTGSNVSSSGDYARKHNPWVNWQDASTNGVPSANNQPLTNWPVDFSLLPTLSFVIPNQAHDMHNPILLPTAITNGDEWLETNLDAYIQWAKTHNSLFILTFDEDDLFSSNRIVTLFIGENVIAGDYSETIDHYDVLRTLEDMYGLPYAGNSATATPITDCWAQIVTGIEDTEMQNLTLYPNPANEKLMLDLIADKEETVSITITDMLSRVVASYHTEVAAGKNKLAFPLHELQTGAYFVTISSSQLNIVQKVVVQN